LGSREGRHLILQRRQLFHIRERQKVAARAERLSDLDERRAEPEQIIFEPDGLLFKSRFFARRTFRAAKDEKAKQSYEAVNDAAVNITTPFLKERDAVTRARFRTATLAHTVVEV